MRRELARKHLILMPFFGRVGENSLLIPCLAGNFASETGSLETPFLQRRVRNEPFARANKRALKPGTWPVVWLSEAPTDVAQLEVLLAPLPFRKMIC
jgi:hypothetical protein